MNDIPDIIGPAVEDLLTSLEAFIAADAELALKPTISLDRFAERSAGLGRWVGQETRGIFGIVPLKAGRLDVVVRFQFQDASAETVEAGVRLFQQRFVAGRINQFLNDLAEENPNFTRRKILKLALEKSDPPDFITEPALWRKIIDYQILFEYQYQDIDAEGIIERILVDVNSRYKESFVLSDHLVHWINDDIPDLELRGQTGASHHVGSLVVLAALPQGSASAPVKISVSMHDVSHEHIFPTLRQFIDILMFEPEILNLGGLEYQVGHFEFPESGSPHSIVLKSSRDFLKVEYDGAAMPDNASVYLQLLS